MTVYYVTVNRPGYLPDGEAMGCETLDDARLVLESELWATFDIGNIDGDDLDVSLELAAITVPGCSVTLGGCAHSITESAEAF